MTDHDTALRLDAFLDGRPASDAQSDPLVAAASTMHTLDLQQRATPSDAFRTQLRQSLFPSSNGVHHLSAADEPVMLTPMRPTPRPTAQTAKSHRFLAIAAALVLLIGGMGAVTRLPLGGRPSPEPSAIPAAFAEASPTEARDAAPSAGKGITSDGTIAWTTSSTDSAFFFPAHLVTERLIFDMYQTDDMRLKVRAIDIERGDIAWAREPGVAQAVLAAYDQNMLVAGSSLDGSDDGALVALNGTTGETFLRVRLSNGLPVGIVVEGNSAFVLSDRNTLDVVDLATGTVTSSIDLTGAAAPWDTVEAPAWMWGGWNLAISGGTLAAVLADGSATGVDVSSGEILWQKVRSEPGVAQVIVTNDRFLIVDDGTVQQLSDDFNAAYGSPIRQPEATPSTINASCLDKVTAISADGAFAPASDGPRTTYVVSVSAETGQAAWAVASTVSSVDRFLGDSSVVFTSHSDTVWPLDPSDLAICSIDNATGAVFQAQSVADISEEVALFVVEDTQPLETVYGVLGGGSFIRLDAALDPSVTSPRLLLEPSLPTGYAWIEPIANGWLLGSPDGEITRIDWTQTKPESGVPEASAKVATPGAGIAWTVDPPEENARLQMSMDVLSDGHLFRMIGVNGDATWVQAIDAESGVVVWQRPFDLGLIAMHVQDGIVFAAGAPRVTSGPTNVLFALDAATGETRWQAGMSGSTSAITTANNRVYVLLSQGQLNAYDRETGALVYRVPLADSSQMPGGPLEITNLIDPTRMAASDSILAVTPGDGTVVGVDMERGEIVWRVYPMLIGLSAVYAIDDHLIAVGDSRLMVASQAHPGSPTVPGMPSSTICQTAIIPARDLATPAAVTAAVQVELIGIAPQSGTVEWTNWADDSTGFRWAENDALELFVSQQADVFPNRSNSVICAMDAATGDVSEKPYAPVAPITILTTQDDQYSLVEFPPNDIGLARPIGETIVTGLVVEIDAYARGFTWIVQRDGAIYLSLVDGRVIKFAL